MISFSKVCEILTDAVPMITGLCPQYAIIPQDEIPGESIKVGGELRKKVQENFNRWKKHQGQHKSPNLVYRGYCKIDNFTGNEVLRMLCHIINKKNDDRYDFKPGNVIYFLKSGSACAAVMFTKTKLLVTTPPPDLSESDADIKFKHLYTKLFNDHFVERYRMKPNKYQEYYSKQYVEEFRTEAEGKFPHFLTTKIKEGSDLFPFGYKFIAMLVSIAYRIVSRGNPRTMPAPFNFDIPFAACIKFAFDNSQTGKITALCGEVGTMPDEDSTWKERARSIRDTAEELVKW